eukprot:RCo008523
MQQGFQIGSRVVDEEGYLGTVRYCGRIEDSPAPSALWLGVEWDDSSRGKYDGAIYGKRYFQCRSPTSGSFMKPSKVRTALSLSTAVLRRYTMDGQERPHLLRVGCAYMVHRERGNSGAFLHLHNVDLSEEGITGASEGPCGRREIADLCPNITQLNLSGNVLRKWADVLEILDQLPQLSLLNLSRNPLQAWPDPQTETAGAEAPPPLEEEQKKAHDSGSQHCDLPRHRALATLILNDIPGLGWPTVNSLVALTPSVAELRLAGNGFTEVQLRVPSRLTSLDLSGNMLQSWEKIVRAIASAAALRCLILCGNPLETIPELDVASLKSPPPLQILSLDQTQISDWGSLERVCRQLPSLAELNVADVPLLAGCEPEQRRNLLIAHLPQLSRLNRSPILPKERQGAERWFVRLHCGDPNPPEACVLLRQKHGDLQPLADVDLDPPDSRVTVLFEDKLLEDYSPDLSLAVQEFKGCIADYLSCDSSNIQLFHKRCYGGVVPIVGTRRKMHSYRILDGDQILVFLERPK